LKDSKRYIPQLGQGGLGLPDRDYYLKNDAKTKEIRAQYLAYMKQIFSLLGENAAQSAQHAAQVMALETRLAKASLTKVELRDPAASYHLTDLDGLQKQGKSTYWSSYFQTIGLQQPGQLNLAHPKFFSEVDKMLDRSSARAMENLSEMGGREQLAPIS